MTETEKTLSTVIGDEPPRPVASTPLSFVLPPSIEQRIYQGRAIERAYAVMNRRIRRFIFHSPTGSGKTILAVIIILRALAKGQRVLFIAHRRELIIQCYRKLVFAGVPKELIGVILGSEPGLRNHSAPIQVASIQSLGNAIPPPATLIFLDECHLAASESFTKILANYPDAFVVGLTATPIRTDGRPLGKVFDEIVEVATYSELIEQGYIVPPFCWSVPPEHEADLEGVTIKNGDFDSDEASERVRVNAVFGFAPKHYHDHARGLRGMAFLPTVKDSRDFADLFNGHGIKTTHLDGTTPKAQRDAVLDDLRHGRIDVISNCGLFIEGLDVVELKAIIMLRPTKSIVVHCQSAGREMRPWNDIQPVLLDHVGNCRRLGKPHKDRDYSLDGRVKKKKDAVTEEIKTCKKCFAIADSSMTTCPACGEPFTAPRRATAHIDDVDLVAMEETKRKATEKAKIVTFERFWQMAYRDGYDQAWVTQQYTDRFGDAPPSDWTPPERPLVEYTAEEKRTQYMNWVGISARQKLPHSWVLDKYKLKYGGHPSELDEIKPSHQIEAPKKEEEKTEAKPVITERVELDF